MAIFDLPTTKNCRRGCPTRAGSPWLGRQPGSSPRGATVVHGDHASGGVAFVFARPPTSAWVAQPTLKKARRLRWMLCTN